MDPGDREDRAPKKDGLSNLAEGLRKGERYSGAALSLVGAVGVFTWLGHWLDGKLGTSGPWFTLVGAALGMTGGFISFFKTVLGDGKKP